LRPYISFFAGKIDGFAKKSNICVTLHSSGLRRLDLELFALPSQIDFLREQQNWTSGKNENVFSIRKLPFSGAKMAI
jgi:hypothetical protein